MEIMDKSVELQDGHYKLKLPFRIQNLYPNNIYVAKQCLTGLKRKYKEFLNDVISKGYAGREPSHQLKSDEGTVWYIPRHGVYHPKKRCLIVALHVRVHLFTINFYKTLILQIYF